MPSAVELERLSRADEVSLRSQPLPVLRAVVGLLEKAELQAAAELDALRARYGAGHLIG